ncbi:histone deacetylase [Photobacterium jeanii]|uniref:Histone deacetylase n=1 Tax=Photobacterium jeanii TaxID=858640 RepID=A0A178KMN9_9GAMM|nr:histone deacetylase [Photobacterium jeanii]OAN18537.1 histone deacetylase [Photobacterium jeanii]PST91781.1 histone deacetylase [Photobacterium jeanii]
MLPLIYHPIYSKLALPPEHRYPITKYRHLFEHLHASLATKDINRLQFHQPSAISLEQVKALHHSDYIDALVNNQLPAAKMRRIGFPWSEQLITRTLTSAGGTCLTTELAHQHGIAIHLSGGYHHAHHDFGSGFCLINDLALAAQHALTLEGIDKVLIIDCDVHHGDGTATILAEHDDIVTFSVHCDKNFPARKPDSNIDLALPRETTTEDYLAAFQPIFQLALAQHQPDIVIYDAGVDIHQDDELGYFNICLDGLYQRDHFVLNSCQQQSIPVAAVVGGGYRKDHQALAPLHSQLIQAALDLV